MSPIQHVLVATDFGLDSERAIASATELAVACNAKLSAVHVFELAAYAYPFPVASDVRRAAQARLDETLSAVRVRSPGAVGLLREGVAWEAIVSTAEEINADVIVTGSHGHRGLERWLIGSIAERVVRISPVPVLTVRTRAGAPPGAAPSAHASAMLPLKHILVPTDFSEHAARAEDMALTFAATFGAKVTLLHVVNRPEYAYAQRTAQSLDDLLPRAQDALDGAIARARLRCSDVEGVLAQGAAWEAIDRFAEEHAVDLIAIGTHGRRGISRVLLGSVAEKVLRTSPVPVLTVSLAARPGASPSAARAI